MDTTDPDIVFDDRGYCNHCTTFLAQLDKQSLNDEDKKRATLDRIIAKIKKHGSNKPYDCVLGISGGVDSSYAAYVLKKMGLRTLLVHMDNGWNAEEAIQNIKHLADQLEFDYESVVLDWEEFRDLQLSFLKGGVIEAETPTDIAISGALHHVAARYGIKYIISGGNVATEGILPKHWHYNAKDMRYLKAIHKRFGTKKLKTFQSFGFIEECYYKLFKGIRIIYLLNYVPFDKEKAMELLIKELSWKYYGGKHHESRYTKFVQSYLLPHKFNIDYRKATFSSQICAGSIGREEALDLLKTPTYNAATINNDLDYVAKKLRIARNELDHIIASPAKTYRDYPNSEKLLTFFYNLYRKLFTVAFICFSGQKIIMLELAESL